MTTDLEGRLREELHEDAQRAQLVNPDRPPAPDVLSMSETRRRARSGRRLVALAAAAIVVAIAAAGIAIRIENPSRVATTAPTPTTAPPDDKGCPLTAEDVSEAIGATFTETSTDCSFETGAGVFPSVDFGYLGASTCTPESLRQEGYSDAVDGLGVDAYSMLYSLGVSLIVCNGDQPFGVIVDGIQGDDLTAAVALAKLVLNG
jgi:hypothetical protein